LQRIRLRHSLKLRQKPILLILKWFKNKKNTKLSNLSLKNKLPRQKPPKIKRNLRRLPQKKPSKTKRRLTSKQRKLPKKKLQKKKLREKQLKRRKLKKPKKL
jgi:hypothetical protein